MDASERRAGSANRGVERGVRCAETRTRENPRPAVLTFVFRLCNARGVRLSERGAARSFVIAAAAVIVAVVGYAGWTLLRPDPYSLSERIVRDARRAVAAEVREFQRDVDDLTDRSKADPTAIGAEIDKHLNAALQGIDDVVDGARDRLADLDVGIRTQRNRLDRIDGRADEARGMVKELAAEAKQKVQAGTPVPQ